MKTLKQAFIDTLSKRGLSTGTLRNYESDLNFYLTYLDDYPSHLALNRSTTLSFGDFVFERYQSDNSRRRRIQTVRAFFDFLMEKGVTDENPLKSLPAAPKIVDIPRPPLYSDIERFWNYLVMEKAQGTLFTSLLAERHLLVFLLVYGCALSGAQLVALTRGDLMMRGLPRVLVSFRKGDPVSIPLTKSFLPLFKEYDLKRKRLAPHLFSGELDGPLFFHANHHTIMSTGVTVRALEMKFHELSKRLGMKMTLKSLRQAAIFRLINQNHPEETIKKWLGVAPDYSLSVYYQMRGNFEYPDYFL